MMNNNIISPLGITTVPHVIKQTTNGERGYDILSRVLEDRIIFLHDDVNKDTAQIIMAELLYLESIDATKDITLYINSPGGSVSDGLSIYDTMQCIKPDVRTICSGVAASMGAFLLAGGAKGKRMILPNAEVMIHQPLGGAQGQATEIEIAAKHILHLKEKLNKMLAENCGQEYEKVCQDTDRDNWLTAEDAVMYGLVDKIITPNGTITKDDLLAKTSNSDN